jgi:hypothetical protein
MPVTNYIYDGNQYLAEADESDTINRFYTNEPDAYTHLISQEEVSSGESSFYHYDAIGSTREVTNSTETVTDEFTYDAWGNRLSRSGTNEIPFQFIGEDGVYHDEVTTLDYTTKSIYSSSIGRMLSPALVFYTFTRYLLNFYSIGGPPSGTAAPRIPPPPPLPSPYPPPLQAPRPPYPPLRAPKPPICISCNEFVDDLPNSGNPVRFAVKKKKGKGQKICSVIVHCEDVCPPGAPEPGFPGLARRTQRSTVIDICLSNKISTDQDFKVIYEHELQHARDFCLDPDIPLNSCDDCKEFEESAHEVSCALAFDKSNEEYDNCVNCGVYASCVLFGKRCMPDDFDKDDTPSSCKSWKDIGVDLPGFPFPKSNL